jgi:hypothetical protein
MNCSLQRSLRQQTLHHYGRTKEISVTSLTVEGSTWQSVSCYSHGSRFACFHYNCVARSKLTRMSDKICLSFSCPLFNDVLKLNALFVASVIMEMLKHRLLNKEGTPQRREATRQG